MIQLRAAIEADLHSLFELDQICFTDGIAYSLSEFRSLLRSKGTIGVVAEDNGVLAGFAMAQLGRLRRSYGGHVVTIDVAPEFRRRGVGRLLMAHIERQVRDAGASWLRLEVAVNNAAALSFYKGLGFEAIGRIRGYYQRNLDAIAMEKILAAEGELIQ
jgi:[ribosomal protein S18]-alanine N-acetyltransferase